MITEVTVVHGIPESLLGHAVKLYDTALSGTCIEHLLDHQQRLTLLHEIIDSRFAFAAIYQDNIVGLAGYQSDSGSFTGASSPRQLLRKLGVRSFVKLLLSDTAYYRPLRYFTMA